MSRHEPEEIAGRLKRLVERRKIAENRLDEYFDRLERAVVYVEWDKIGRGSSAWYERLTAIVHKVGRTPGLEQLFLMVPGRKEVDVVSIKDITELTILIEKDEYPLLSPLRAEEIFAETVKAQRADIQEAIDYHLSQID